MIFSIFDTGNLVVSYEEEDEAMKALAELAQDPDADPQLLLIAFADDGGPVADCIPGERLVIPA
jgi:hypothetical protein